MEEPSVGDTAENDGQNLERIEQRVVLDQICQNSISSLECSDKSIETKKHVYIASPNKLNVINEEIEASVGVPVNIDFLVGPVTNTTNGSDEKQKIDLTGNTEANKDLIISKGFQRKADGFPITSKRKIEDGTIHGSSAEVRGPHTPPESPPLSPNPPASQPRYVMSDYLLAKMLQDEEDRAYESANVNYESTSYQSSSTAISAVNTDDEARSLVEQCWELYNQCRKIRPDTDVPPPMSIPFVDVFQFMQGYQDVLNGNMFPDVESGLSFRVPPGSPNVPNSRTSPYDYHMKKAESPFAKLSESSSRSANSSNLTKGGNGDHAADPYHQNKKEKSSFKSAFDKFVTSATERIQNVPATHIFSQVSVAQSDVKAAGSNKFNEDQKLADPRLERGRFAVPEIVKKHRPLIDDDDNETQRSATKRRLIDVIQLEEDYDEQAELNKAIAESKREWQISMARESVESSGNSTSGSSYSKYQINRYRDAYENSFYDDSGPSTSAAAALRNSSPFTSKRSAGMNLTNESNNYSNATVCIDTILDIEEPEISSTTSSYPDYTYPTILWKDPENMPQIETIPDAEIRKMPEEYLNEIKKEQKLKKKKVKNLEEEEEVKSETETQNKENIECEKTRVEEKFLKIARSFVASPNKVPYIVIGTRFEIYIRFPFLKRPLFVQNVLCHLQIPDNKGDVMAYLPDWIRRCSVAEFFKHAYYTWMGLKMQQLSVETPLPLDVQLTAKALYMAKVAQSYKEQVVDFEDGKRECQILDADEKAELIRSHEVTTADVDEMRRFRKYFVEEQRDAAKRRRSHLLGNSQTSEIMEKAFSQKIRYQEDWMQLDETPKEKDKCMENASSSSGGVIKPADIERVFGSGSISESNVDGHCSEMPSNFK